MSKAIKKEDISKARLWVEDFVHWYNDDHRHSNIQFVTPIQRHAGEDCEILIKTPSRL